MKIDVKFKEINQHIVTEFVESELVCDTLFQDVLIVERTDIPPQYGLVTYDNNKTITVS